MASKVGNQCVFREAGRWKPTHTTDTFYYLKAHREGTSSLQSLPKCQQPSLRTGTLPARLPGEHGRWPLTRVCLWFGEAGPVTMTPFVLWWVGRHAELLEMVQPGTGFELCQ